MGSYSNSPEPSSRRRISIEVKGTVRNDGTLLRGALIEIWNANHYGRYRHHGGSFWSKLDENFFGIGRVITDEYGNYALDNKQVLILQDQILEDGDQTHPFVN